MEINLLPWRAEIIAYNKKMFMQLMFIAVILAGLFLFFISHIFFYEASYVQSYITSLEKAKITIVQSIAGYLKDKKMQEEISARILALKKLQNTRFETVRLLNELTHITPKGVYFTKLTRTDNQVELTGDANSNLLIAKLMDEINQSPDLDVVSLKKVEKLEGSRVVSTQFDLKMALTMFPALPMSAIQTEKNKESIIRNPIQSIQELRSDKEKKLDDISKGK